MPKLPMNRRQMLRMSAGTLLSGGLWPGALEARDPDTEEFRFIALNDIHYLNHKCGVWLEGLVKQMKAGPEFDFCLLIGDLAEDGKADQLGPVRDIFKTLGKPIHVVIGNHDYIKDTDRQPFVDLFPALNYHFNHKGWQFAALDSSEGIKSTAAIQQPTFQWLDERLPKADKRKPTVIFTHFPLGPNVIRRSTNAEELLERLKPLNLQAVFNGHFHAFTERKVGSTTFTTGRCCSFSRNNHDFTKAKGYFLCHAKDGKIERTFVEAKGA